MDVKTLKKLADACRKAGIKSFKNAEVEFTLTDEAPVSNYKKRKGDESISDEPIKTNDLSEDELRFWSADMAETPEAQGS